MSVLVRVSVYGVQGIPRIRGIYCQIALQAFYSVFLSAYLSSLSFPFGYLYYANLFFLIFLLCTEPIFCLFNWTS